MFTKKREHQSMLQRNSNSKIYRDLTDYIHYSNVRFNFLKTQTKPVISQPGDPYEEEANRVAEQVMRVSSSSQRSKGISTIDKGAEIPHASSEKRLDTATKEFMESRFGYDFGNVRIYDDKYANESAEGVNANAYTFGNHIVFNKDQFLPNTSQGKQLLAHELVHVVQSGITTNRYLPFDRELGAPNYEKDTIDFQSCLGHRSIDNNVQAQMLYREQKTTPTKDITFTKFKEIMDIRFHITSIKVGSMQEQISLLVPIPGQPIPQGIILPNWKKWDPGAKSFIYPLIIESFNDFADTFGGTPEVKEIIFFNLDYELDNGGTVIPRSDVAATFGAGKLMIFRTLETSPKEIPMSRSTTMGKGGVTKVTPVPVPSREESVKRLISHELGHGISEAVYSLDPNMWKDYEAMVGWTRNPVKLFDVQDPDVLKALKNNQEPPESFHITKDNWNDPKWKEQPVSQYSLKGPSEDFAEAVMVFIYKPTVLKNRSPARYKFIVDRKDKWLSRLSKSNP